MNPHQPAGENNWHHESVSKPTMNERKMHMKPGRLIQIAVVSLCAAVAGAFFVVRPARAQTEQSAGLVITTGDLARPYEVIDIAISYQEFKSLSFKNDPLVNALKAADAELRAKAKKVEASAIVALKFDFENRTEKDEGRLLAYGTLVRFK